ncbi:MAG TPA: hypothetical protein PKD86_01835 [Gemmatales bacterium]|nr:hypothetical protein [Gemmatales bacterium]
MLISEARWYGRWLRKFPAADLYPQLNLGSQTLHFRTHVQPWIERYLFAPARQRGGAVVHTDLQPAPGVDLVGDLTDPAFHAVLKARQFRSVVCSNLLEHVTQPKLIARVATEVVVPGGLLFVSVPYLFPYHADPIDTMFRPSPEELANLFPGTRIVEARIVHGWLIRYGLERLRQGWPGKANMPQATPVGLPEGAGSRVRSPGDLLQVVTTWVPWLWRPFAISCLVLRREGCI